MKRWEYAIAVEELDGSWTLWLQEQHGKDLPVSEAYQSFEYDRAMLSFMSLHGWGLATSIQLKDKLPRLIFKRRIK